jgi:hypothetical protein
VKEVKSRFIKLIASVFTRLFENRYDHVVGEYASPWWFVVLCILTCAVAYLWHALKLPDYGPGFWDYMADVWHSFLVVLQFVLRLLALWLIAWVIFYFVSGRHNKR